MHATYLARSISELRRELLARDCLLREVLCVLKAFLAFLFLIYWTSSPNRTMRSSCSLYQRLAVSPECPGCDRTPFEAQFSRDGAQEFELPALVHDLSKCSRGSPLPSGLLRRHSSYTSRPLQESSPSSSIYSVDCVAKQNGIGLRVVYWDSCCEAHHHQ